MHDLINKLAFSLFRKKSIEECDIGEIRDLVKQYPYFSSAQLLLAAKEKQTASAGFENQLSRASLYVNNPLWLDHLLNTETEEKIEIPQTTPVEEVLEEPNNDELVIEKTHHEFILASKKEEAAMPAVATLTETQESKEEIVIEKSKEQLVFEPYYTIDYFASQGIKNVIEEKPKDRFSQQLKSFTEWLKTIRQLPPQQVAAMTDPGSEQKVVELATHSLDEGNVETEAMAEVWIKQGQPEKAVAIYRKLSLLNPSKNSYFASKIELLNDSN